MKRYKNWMAAAVAAWVLPALPAAAQDVNVGIARSKNLVQSTVTIDDQTFKVTDRTRILDRAGRPMAFEAVETQADLGPIGELDRVTYAYDAANDVLTVLRATSAVQ